MSCVCVWAHLCLSGAGLDAHGVFALQLHPVAGSSEVGQLQGVHSHHGNRWGAGRAPTVMERAELLGRAQKSTRVT